MADEIRRQVLADYFQYQQSKVLHLGTRIIGEVGNGKGGEKVVVGGKTYAHECNRISRQRAYTESKQSVRNHNPDPYQPHDVEDESDVEF
jgi:hypothetical protein